MPRAAWLIAVVVAVSACSTSAPMGPSLVAPMDGGDPPGDGSIPDDAGVEPGPIDAPSDAPTNDAGMDTTDLAVICGGTVPVTLDQWEDCYRKRTCEWDVGCFPSYPFRDVADCIASGETVSGGRLAAERRDRKRAVEQARASINVEAFTQCLIRTNATRCNTALHEPACLTRFTGTFADGADCLADVDCASPDAVCSSSCPDACCVGTCQRKLREHEPCRESESCEPGLVCNGVECVSGDAGTPCDRGSVNQCDFGTFCDAQTLRCTPTRAPGAPCTAGLQCGEDHTCVGSNPGHCLRVSRPGDRCSGFCFGHLNCDETSKCRSLPVLGESCPGFIGCIGANTICKNEMCILRSDVGVSCAAQTCLPGLFCTSEVGDPTPRCAARRVVGESCATPGHCESLLCSGSNSQTDVCLPWSNTCL